MNVKEAIIIGVLMILVGFETAFLHGYFKSEPGKRDWINLWYAVCCYVAIFVILFYVGVDSFIGG